MSNKRSADQSAASKLTIPEQGEFPKSIFETTEFDVLDDYLGDPFNHSVYIRLRKTLNGGKYDHWVDNYSLELFRRFYRALSFVKANLDKPLVVEKKMREIGENTFTLKIFALLISYDESLNNPAMRESRALAHLKYLREQSIEKLIRSRTPTETISSLWHVEPEILRDTLANETKNAHDQNTQVPSQKVTSNASESGCPTCGKAEKYPDRNLERTVLFLSVVFEELGIKAETKQQIDAARIITGYSGNTIKPLMHKNGTNVSKEIENPSAYKKDFEFVSDLFRKLQREDLAKKVEDKV